MKSSASGTFRAQLKSLREVAVESTGAAVVDRSVHELLQQLEQQARARLGPERWARAYAAGRTISVDSLMRDFTVVKQGT